MSFDQCTIGILIDGGNNISILAPSCNTVGNCIVVNSGHPWAAVIDGQNTNSGDLFTSKVQYPSFMLKNISNNNGQIKFVTIDDNAGIGGKNSLGTCIYGNTRGVNLIYQTNPSEKAPNRPAALAPGGKYPSISAPQYADKKVSDVINLKDVNQNGGFNLHGYGNVDNTQALEGALNTAATKGKVAYLPFGV
ncbi:Glucan endo-1,3-beta-glucosidase BGN13.1 [Beauveria bassiana]|nr:Glucan endo-1,3-beta-glucosidase BGN13.1 [Beauveria bassiana]